MSHQEDQLTIGSLHTWDQWVLQTAGPPSPVCKGPACAGQQPPRTLGMSKSGHNLITLHRALALEWKLLRHRARQAATVRCDRFNED